MDTMETYNIVDMQINTFRFRQLERISLDIMYALNTVDILGNKRI